MTMDIFENLWRVINTYKYKSMDNIPEEMKCTICKGLLVVPCSIRCGCRFCHSCIIEYLNESNTYCPKKSKYCQLNPVDLDRDVVRDYPMNIQLSQMKVKCINKNCEFSDELNAIEDHIKMCNKTKGSCPFFPKGCDKTELNRDEMNEHLINEIGLHMKLVVQMINNISENSTNMDQSENRAIPNSKEILRKFYEKNDKSLEIQQLQEELNSLKVGNQFMMKEMSALKKNKDLNEPSLLTNSPDIYRIKEDLRSVTTENKNLKDEFEGLKALGEIINVPVVIATLVEIMAN